MRAHIYRENIGSVDGSVVGSVVGQSWVKRGSDARSSHEEDIAIMRSFMPIPSASVNEAVAFTILICRSVLNLHTDNAFRILARPWHGRT